MNENELKRLRSIAGYLDGKRSQRPHVLSLAYASLRRPPDDVQLDRLIFQALEDALEVEVAHITMEEYVAPFATNSILIRDYSYTRAIDSIWQYQRALDQASTSALALASHLVAHQSRTRTVRRPIEIEIPNY